MRAEIIVSGKVQHVSYRKFVKEKADLLMLKGWCKNLENSTVSILVEGDKPQINNLLELLKIGPKKAIVKDLKIQWSDKKEFEDFKIL